MSIEATGVYPDSIFGSTKRLEQQFMDEINQRVETPDYFLHLNILNAPTSNPPFAKISKCINKKLAKFDYNEVVKQIENSETSELPQIKCSHDSWDIEFFVIPKKEVTRGKELHNSIGITMWDLHLIDSISPIRSGIENKYSHYGELDIPYILAMNIFGEIVRDSSIIDALYGDEVFYVETRSKGRDLIGSWRSEYGWQKTRISGILTFQQLSSSILFSIEPTLWHHPAAQYPLKVSDWSISQYVLDGSQLKQIGGESIIPLIGITPTQYSELQQLDYSLTANL